MGFGRSAMNIVNHTHYFSRPIINVLWFGVLSRDARVYPSIGPNWLNFALTTNSNPSPCPTCCSSSSCYPTLAVSIPRPGPTLALALHVVPALVVTQP